MRRTGLSAWITRAGERLRDQSASGSIALPTSTVYRRQPMSSQSSIENTSGNPQRLARVAFLGDLNGAPGRRVLEARVEDLRSDHKPDLLVANAENLRNGSGLNPDLYRILRDLGIDAITLGDHVYRDRRVIPLLEDPDEPIARPANLSRAAPGKRWIRIPIPAEAGGGEFLAFSVLGRVMMNLPANDPFETADEVLAANPGIAGSLVDLHMEATSEKAAVAMHLDGRISMALGTHTHVPTADARVFRGGTAFQTDVGMCGPYDSIIGRSAEPVLRHMRSAVHTPYDMGSGDERLCGAMIEFRAGTGRASRITPFQYPLEG
ncbi:MAG: metallophosphoesterase [Planctomycetaceae bacterium]|nr:metallophosphoesterase [Planctomycetaceae bacterium]